MALFSNYPLLTLVYLLIESLCILRGSPVSRETVQNSGNKSRSLVRIAGNHSGAGDYYFGEELVSFNEAQINCQEGGLRLLSIDNQLEQNVVTNFLSDAPELNGWTGRAWTSGTDEGTMGTYYWNYRGGFNTAMQYKNFDSIVTHCDGHCVTLSNDASSLGKWFLNQCLEKRPYFCEA